MRNASLKGLKMQQTKKTELGIEKRCSKCHEYWPADSEFFMRRKDSKDGLDGYCKACRQESRNNAYHKDNPAAEYRALHYGSEYA